MEQLKYIMVGYVCQDKNSGIHFGSFPCLVNCIKNVFPSITEFNNLAKQYLEATVCDQEILSLSVISCEEKTKRELYCLYPKIRRDSDLMEIYV